MKTMKTIPNAKFSHITLSYTDPLEISEKDYDRDTIEVDYDPKNKTSSIIKLSRRYGDGNILNGFVFNGELLSENKLTEEDVEHSGRIGADLLEVALYKTIKGRYICSRKRIAVGNLSEITELKLAENEAEVVGFFGQNMLAHDLYRSARIKNYTHIEDGYDADKHSKDYEWTILYNDNTPDYAFYGKHIAGEEIEYGYGLCEEVCLYGLPNGKFVCLKVAGGFPYASVVRIAKDMDQVRMFFGHLAQEDCDDTFYIELEELCESHQSEVE